MSCVVSRVMSVGRSGKRLDMTPEERDARTVLCMQVSQRLKTKDVEEFFSSVGKVGRGPSRHVFFALPDRWGSERDG